MTALEWIVNEAKKIKKQYPKRFKTWREYVAQASAIYSSKHRGKSPVGKKKVGAVKIIQKGEKKDAKVTKVLQQVRGKSGVFKGYKKIAGTHKDTKSHNVNIRVVSGLKKPRTIGSMDSKIGIRKLREIARNENPMNKYIIKILMEKLRDYDTTESLFKDILYNGLQSGIISEMIYYSDTIAYYKKYKTYIMQLLTDTMRDFGTNSPAEIFGKNWDKDDPFAQDTANQNLLAWFSFEEYTRQLSYKLGFDI